MHNLRPLVLVAALGVAGLAAPAQAGTGCNGVINPLVWGCAPWDNNNGPNFPYYKKSRVQIPRSDESPQLSCKIRK